MGGFERVAVPQRLKAELVEKARAMRRSPTPSEARFWAAVRGRRFCGVKFRRQAPIAQFIVDFYCPAYRLIVELDGPAHEADQAYDAWRQRYLEALGMRVLRIEAREVEHKLEAALERVRAYLGT